MGSKTASKATRAQRQYRVHALLGLMNQGLGSYELECYCVENFKVSSKVAASLVDEAYSFAVVCMDVTDLKRLGAITLRRLEFIYRQSLNTRDYVNARGCVADIARIFYIPVRDFLQENPPPPPPVSEADVLREYEEGDF